MALVTRTVSSGGPLTNALGVVLSGVTVEFTLVDSLGNAASVFDTVSNEYISGVVSAVTDTLGNFTCLLWPNDRGATTSQYKCVVKSDPDTGFMGTVPSGTGALTLAAFRGAITSFVPTQQTALSNHIADSANPHATTKAQVGLGNVDNTADTVKTFTKAQVGLGNVDNTADINKTFTKAQVGLGNVDNTADTVKTFTKAQVGLGNVDNTADINKTFTKAQVGLGNVDNTADVNKPLSTPQTAALAAPSGSSLVGFPGSGHGAAAATVQDALNNIVGLLPITTAMVNGYPYFLGNQLGTPASPTTNTQPLVSFTKYVSPSGGPNYYEGGAGWFSTYREGGTQATKGLTGYMQVDGGTADAVAIHGFANNALGTTASIFSGWFTTHDVNTTVIAQAFGVEIDLVLFAARSRRTVDIGTKSAVGLWINNQSDAIGNNMHATAAIGITAEAIAANYSAWYTGIFITANSIVPGASNEAIQINGASLAANRYTGIRMLGNFDIGLDLSGGTYTGSNAAILLPNLGVIYALDSVAGSYPVMYLNSTPALNSLVLGQGVPGGVILYTGVRCLSTLAVPGAATPVLTAATTVTTGAGAGAGTLSNAPAAGNPTKWIPFNDAGTTRYIPAW